MARRFISLSFLVLMLGACAHERELTYVASVAATTDYVHRGLSQSSEKPALQVGAGVRTRGGYYAHAWLTSLDTNDLAPDFGGRGAELSVLTGVAKPLSDRWLWELNLSRYESFATSQILDYDHTELGVALNYSDRLRFAFAYSPRATDHAPITNAKLSGPRRVVEVAGQLPLADGWSLTGGVGYSDLDNVSDVSHLFWSAGTAYDFGRYRASIVVYGTDDRARGRFVDDRAETRIALMLISSFSTASDANGAQR